MTRIFLAEASVLTSVIIPQPSKWSSSVFLVASSGLVPVVFRLFIRVGCKSVGGLDALGGVFVEILGLIEWLGRLEVLRPPFGAPSVLWSALLDV